MVSTPTGGEAVPEVTIVPITKRMLSKFGDPTPTPIGRSCARNSRRRHAPQGGASRIPPRLVPQVEWAKNATPAPFFPMIFPMVRSVEWTSGDEGRGVSLTLNRVPFWRNGRNGKPQRGVPGGGWGGSEVPAEGLKALAGNRRGLKPPGSEIRTPHGVPHLWNRGIEPWKYPRISARRWQGAAFMAHPGEAEHVLTQIATLPLAALRGL